MTTITMKDGIVAADRRVSFSSCHDGVETIKVAQRKDGTIAVASGVSAICAEFRRWMLAGEKPKARPTFATQADPDVASGYIIRPGGVIEHHSAHGWYKVESNFFAIGSGSEYALGAMAMGASAAEAVKIASRFDGATGPDVDIFKIPPKPIRATRKATRRRR